MGLNWTHWAMLGAGVALGIVVTAGIVCWAALGDDPKRGHQEHESG